MFKTGQKTVAFYQDEDAWRFVTVVEVIEEYTDDEGGTVYVTYQVKDALTQEVFMVYPNDLLPYPGSKSD